MKKALLLHGWEGNSQSNWFPWLRGELENQGYEVIVPNLPEAEAPVLKDWLDSAYELSGKLNSEDIIIGHSMGSKTAMHFLEKHGLIGIQVLLVGPTYEAIEDELDIGDPLDVKQKLRDFHEQKLDFGLVNSLNNTYTVFLSDNDKYIRMDSAKKYYGQLKNIEFVEFRKAGHFTSIDGYKEFQNLLQYI